jgi:hypothetical protein
MCLAPGGLEGMGGMGMEGMGDAEMPFLKKWVRTKHAILFRVSNRTGMYHNNRHNYTAYSH